MKGPTVPTNILASKPTSGLNQMNIYAHGGPKAKAVCRAYEAHVLISFFWPTRARPSLKCEHRVAVKK